MGWGIYLYPEIYYSKVGYRCKDDVFREIEDTKKVITMLEQKLLALVMTTEPQKMMPQSDIDEGISPLEWLKFEYREIIGDDYDETLKGYYWRLFKLELLYDYWDAAHNSEGKAVSPPKGMYKWPRTAYMDGDFIDSVYEETEEKINTKTSIDEEKHCNEEYEDQIHSRSY